jgi:hypothetical protein
VSSQVDLSRPWISSGMTLSLSSHQTKAVTLICMAERKGVSSRANLLISTRYLWVTLQPSSHHAEVVTFNLFLGAKDEILSELFNTIVLRGKY